MDLRCESGILFGRLVDDGYLEVKCRSHRCGAGPGVVVLHRFDPLNGELIGTYRYRDPLKEGSENDTTNATAVRHP
jgi:hypothetical protein